MNRLHYRMDRAGYTRTGFNHLFLVPADGGTARELTTGDWSVGAPFDALTFGAAWDWLPDGKTIVTDGLAESDGDMNYRDSNIYAIDVATGARKRLTPERGRWTTPMVSPDGSQIAFAGFPFTRHTYQTQDLFLMNPDGSGVKNISGGMDRDPGFGPAIWAPDGSGLYIAPGGSGLPERRRSSRSTARVPRPVTTGAQVISLGGHLQGGRAGRDPLDVHLAGGRGADHPHQGRCRCGPAHRGQRGPARGQEARRRPRRSGTPRAGARRCRAGS